MQKINTEYSIKPTVCNIGTDASIPKKCNCATGCLYLPYYNNKDQTKELLTFIVHGQKNADIIFQDLNKIKISLSPSIWPFEYRIGIFLDDENRLVHICPINSQDLFNIVGSFASRIKSNFLNITGEG